MGKRQRILQILKFSRALVHGISMKDVATSHCMPMQLLAPFIVKQALSEVCWLCSWV